MARNPSTNFGSAMDLYTALSIHDEILAQVERLRRRFRRDKTLSALGQDRLRSRADELVMFADRIREHLGDRVYFNEELGEWRENKRWRVRRKGT